MELSEEEDEEKINRVNSMFDFNKNDDEEIKNMLKKSIGKDC